MQGVAGEDGALSGEGSRGCGRGGVMGLCIAAEGLGDRAAAAPAVLLLERLPMPDCMGT